MLALNNPRALRRPSWLVLVAGALGCGGLAQDCLPDEPCPSGQLPPYSSSGPSAFADPTPLQATEEPKFCSGSQRRHVIASQDEVNELTGCTVWRGNLYLFLNAELDLSPLSSLETIEGILSIAGQPSSPHPAPLAQLEQLQSVASLFLYDLSVTSLSPLRSLLLTTFPNGEDSGRLVIQNCVSLRDLQGLETPGQLRDITIEDNPQLESLAGLTLPEQLDGLEVTGNPKLASFGSAQTLQTIETLSIDQAALTDLSALQNLKSVDSLTLSKIGPLSHLRGLRSLERVERLVVSSVSLGSFAGLSSLTSLRSFSIRGAGELNNIDALAVPDLKSLSMHSVYGTGLNLRGLSFSALTTLRLRQTSLLEGPDLRDVLQMEFIQVTDNSALQSLNGLQNLRQADLIEIRYNNTLEILNLGQLQTVVGSLDVACNPLLPSQWWQPLTEIDAPGFNLNGNLESPEPCQ